MASIEPPQWTSEEFHQLLLDEHPDDPTYVDAAREGFVATLSTSDLPSAHTEADSNSEPNVGEPSTVPTTPVPSTPAHSPLQLFPVP